MVFRCFAEKKPGFDVEAQRVYEELKTCLDVPGLRAVRIFHRYDAEGISPALYAMARETVFSEPQVDRLYDEVLPALSEPNRLFAVEALPGQFDQRADSCAQCIQILSGADRPVIGYAKVFGLLGALSEGELEKIRAFLINPVETRQAAFEKPETLARSYPPPEPVAVVTGFLTADAAELERLRETCGLAMELDDLRFMQAYFTKEERREPTMTELRVVDTYWSDHCRHTTFETRIDAVTIEDPAVQSAYHAYEMAREAVYGEANRPKTLMDLATIGAKVLKKRGLLQNLDESEEVNACSVRVRANVDGEQEDWLLMFKNETHNHPTEIEPYGGAATCIGGAIRDPLSGRAYVYQAMRVTGSGDPRTPVADTLQGKLSQRRLTTTAAQGYSAYGNQIGLATGLVHECYHPGYVAKRMEVGAVVGAAPAANVVREVPTPGDRVILVGGRTGRDGCGGATGSSKTHDLDSVERCAAEVQKGNAPEERKLQRLFRKPAVSRLIRRCNDFGAGGVSVAIGELADGLEIDLNMVKKKYEGLDGTELAISESQERMAVVVAEADAEVFIAAAEEENLEAAIVAVVTERKRLVMRIDGRVIVDLSRAFLASNGAEKHTEVWVEAMPPVEEAATWMGSISERMEALVSDLRFCSQRGLGERFDGTIGAAGVLAPYGGACQMTPCQVMAALLPTEKETDTASVMAFGFDPYIAAQNPFAGARDAVVTSAAKLVAAGCDPANIYLTFQEYFPRLHKEPKRWGMPFAALLGALEAQLALEIGAIGGKDSMSGSFLELDVPPTLISFAVAPCGAARILSPEFKAAGRYVCLFPPGRDLKETKAMWKRVGGQVTAGVIASAWALTEGGAAEGIFKMALGNWIGFQETDGLDTELLFRRMPGGLLAECTTVPEDAVFLGVTTETPSLTLGGETMTLARLRALWEGTLADIFPTDTGISGPVPALSCEKRPPRRTGARIARPRVVIPVFPGTNCEEDTARAVRRAGGIPEIVLIRNLRPELLRRSAETFEAALARSQMLILPGGFSGGDEPEGSAKFIASFFRNPRLTDAVHELLQNRDGLILGICNGFQALVKLGLLPFGRISQITEDCPTLTFNQIGRHQSRYVTTRVASTASPWMNGTQVGAMYTVPVSHGEGRFAAGDEVMASLIENGQVATQYVDRDGRPAMDIAVNPNGSRMAVEGLLSPDGRVLGKMAHTERCGSFVAKNISGNLHQPVFESGVAYYRL